jgi:hypothetical protein
MTALTATPATLSAVLATAHGGDTLALASGAYGDVSVIKRAFSPALVITSADPAHPAIFRSLNINACSGLRIDHITVAFTPDAKTVAWSPGVIIQNSHDVSLAHSTVIGGPSVNGVDQTATKLDATQNVIGLPPGQGVAVVSSQDVSVTDNEIAQFEHLVVLSHVARVLVQHNDLHDSRRTPVTGSDLTDVTVDGNTMRAVTPWMPTGMFGGAYDHGDFLAFWSATGQTTPNARVAITNNIMAQTTGAAILGMWFQGTPTAPFIDFRIVGNTIMVPNYQGIMLTHSQGGVIARNTLIQTQVASMTAEERQRQRPAVLLLAGVSGVAVTGNQVSRATSDTSKGVNSETGTVILTGFIAG